MYCTNQQLVFSQGKYVASCMPGLIFGQQKTCIKHIYKLNSLNYKGFDTKTKAKILYSGKSLISPAKGAGIRPHQFEIAPKPRLGN